MATMKGPKTDMAHLVLSASDLAQVEGMLVLSSLRGVAESILAMAATPHDLETEGQILNQLLTLRQLRDELKAEFEMVDVALGMIAAYLTNTEVSL